MHLRLSLDPFEQLPLTRTVRASSGRNLRVKNVRRLEKLFGKLKEDKAQKKKQNKNKTVVSHLEIDTCTIRWKCILPSFLA